MPADTFNPNRRFKAIDSHVLVRFVDISGNTTQIVPSFYWKKTDPFGVALKLATSCLIDPHYGNLIDLRDFRFSLGKVFLTEDSKLNMIQGWEDALVEKSTVEITMTRILRNNKHRIGNRTLRFPADMAMLQT